MKENSILVYSEIFNSRTDYIFSYLICDLLGAELVQTTDPAAVSAFTGPVIYYTTEKRTGKICIRPSGLLETGPVQKSEIKTGKWGDLPVLFVGDKECPVPFDIFSASFWMITRYEEYLDFSPDSYSHFPASDSLAVTEGFAGLPVVNLWAAKLAEVISEIYPAFRPLKKNFRWMTTVDVDSAWAFLHKSSYRTWGGFMKALVKGSDLGTRIKVLKGESEDPFYTFPLIRDLHSSNPDRFRIFFLTGTPGEHDPNISPAHPEWRRLVQEIAAEFTVGMHPSYSSNRSFSELRSEYEQLSELLPYPLVNSRQHFLKLRFPSTYRSLNELGIQNDYTMGWPSVPGFRAGVCTPFYFYDLEEEKKTGLRVWPFAVMDRTLKDYLHKSPEESIAVINELISAVEKAGGWFIPVWHNESLSDFGEWKGWKKVYTEMLKTLSDKG